MHYPLKASNLKVLLLSLNWDREASWLCLGSGKGQGHIPIIF